MVPMWITCSSRVTSRKRRLKGADDLWRVNMEARFVTLGVGDFPKPATTIPAPAYRLLVTSSTWACIASKDSSDMAVGMDILMRQAPYLPRGS